MLFERGGARVQGRNWMERIVDGMELESELFPALPVIEIAGDRRILIERHRGILEYSGERIKVKVQYGAICICGSGLVVVRMSREQLVICGEINCVQLHRRCR